MEEAADIGLSAALRENGASADSILGREAGRDDIFPWERLNVGVSRKFLYSEWVKYRHALATPPCPEAGCGVCGLCGMHSFLDQERN